MADGTKNRGQPRGLRGNSQWCSGSSRNDDHSVWNATTQDQCDMQEKSKTKYTKPLYTKYLCAVCKNTYRRELILQHRVLKSHQRKTFNYMLTHVEDHICLK